jgi:putative tryptophan/tyrosine transport system substrate-binding protein
VKRRELIALATGAAVAWPLAVNAQQPERMRRIGAMMPFSENDPRSQAGVTVFAQALERLGWVEGKNIHIDFRFAAGDPALYKTYAAELVGLKPDAILASPTPAVAELRQLTHTVPIVGVYLVDPVGLGFVQSLARPGGNITGFSSYDAPLIGKWFQLLKEAAPGTTRIAVIFNPDTGFLLPRDREIAGARDFGVTVRLAPVRDDAGIEKAIAGEARAPGGGLVTLPDSFNVTHRDAIIAAAARHKLPDIGIDIFPRAGGLMSYWFDSIALYAQAASYIDRILKGASPADLPVQQPTKFLLIINLKTAKTLGLTVPPSILDIADEVIE